MLRAQSSFITTLIIRDMMNPIKQWPFALLVCLATWSANGETLPNMVFLMTDDQGWLNKDREESPWANRQ